MQTREIVDLAAFIAAQGPGFLGGAGQLPESALAQYWTASKCRLDRWNRLLRRVQDPARTSPQEEHLDWSHLQAVCEEILVSEMVTRVWSSLLTALDYLSGGGEAQPLAANVL